MYAAMKPKLEAALKTVSSRPVEMVLNTHFHGDHIQGNEGYRETAVIIAQENVRKRLIQNHKPESPTLQRLPNLTFSNQLSIFFNGEEITLTHYPHSHTDGDVAVYFTRSKVLHLGDMYFAGMFPAVYSEGGGSIRWLIKSLERIAGEIPADTIIIPGHGDPGTLTDLNNYILMLKETVAIVEKDVRRGKTLQLMQAEKVLAKYDSLGSGGAQTTDQYIAMLDKLIRTELADRLMKDQAGKK
jgi:glyoxylase-like metal-dependent hydrolase (beta-lactamase superfamily II)